MNTVKRTSVRLTGIVLAVVMLLSCTFTAAPVLAGTLLAAAEGGLSFTVPETIYLAPSVGGSTQMQYFLNVNPDGSVPQGYDTQGIVCFSNPLATQVQIICSDPYVTLTQTSGTSAVSATIGGHLQSSVPSGTTRLLAWTASYTENGQPKQVQTYSVLYAPSEDPAGAIAAADAYKNSTSFYAACSTFIYGVQTIRYSASPSLQLDGNVNGSATIGGTGKYKYPLASHTAVPPTYAGGNQSPAAANLLRSVDSQTQMTSQSGTAFGYVPCGDTRDILVAGGMGRIVYDMSRVTRIGQIPNFYIHSFLNGAGSTGDFSDTVRELEDRAYYYIAETSADNLTSAYGTQYLNGSYKTQSTVTVPSPDFGNISLCGGYRTLYSAVLRSWKVKPPLYTASDRVQATAAAGCEFYGVDKSEVRALYYYVLSHARQYDGNSAAWQCYQNEMRAAAEYLGTPTDGSAFDLNALMSAAQAVQGSDPLTLTLDPNGGVFMNGSSESMTVSWEPESTCFVPRDLRREGYWFAGWQRADGSMFVDREYTFGSADETLTAQWVEDTYVRFTFGSYPQMLVTDTELNAALQSIPHTWTSYRYYIGSGNYCDGQMVQSDFMQYCDVTYAGQKYRGVQFTQYRPRFTSYSSNAGSTFQDDNGYVPNTIYWFRWEPLQWRLLDADTGLVLCERLIDAQPNNNYLRYDSASGHYYGDAAKTYLANDYVHSDIRSWLTDETDEDSFLNTAFSAPQRSTIVSTTLDNSAYSSAYARFNGASTTDKVFLLSWNEVKDTRYGFPSHEDTCDIRLASGTDYAQCQGLDVYSTGYSHWSLRSPGHVEYTSCLVSMYGTLGDHNNTDGVFTGIRPAMRINPAYIASLTQGTADTYTLTLHPNGGTFADGSTASQDVTGQSGMTFALPTNLVRSGFKLAGWKRSNGSLITSNVYTFGSDHETLTAQWTPLTFTLTLDPNGGAWQNHSTTALIYTQAAGSTLTLSETPHRDGYSFTGWALVFGGGALSGNQYTFGSANGTVRAKWTKLATLTLDPNGGKWQDNSTTAQIFTQAAGSTLTLSETPSRDGYSFTGWELVSGSTLSGDVYTFGTEDETLTAQWTPNTYTVTYDGNGATGGSTVNSMHTYGVAHPLNANGYERVFTVTYDHNYAGSADTTDTAAASFDGWNTQADGSGTGYADEAVVLNLATSDGVLFPLYAQWTDGSVTLPTPARNGYTFDGWFTDADCQIPAGTGGNDYTPAADCTLYAKWTPNTYTVTFRLDGGTWADGTTADYTSTGSIGDALVITPPIQAGYTFIGWAFSDGSTGTFDRNTNTYVYGSTDDTLTAQWQKDGMLRLKYNSGPGGRPITPGSIVEVTAELCENPGLISLMTDIHYDTAVLELIQVNDLNLFGTDQMGNSVFTAGNDLSAEPFRCIWSDDTAQTNHTETGDLVVYTFRVRNTAQPGLTTIWLSCDPDNTLDCGLNSVALTTQSVDLPISVLTGDANGDGMINAADALALAQYLLNPAAYPVAPANADLNQDGAVDQNDLTLLQQFIVGGYGVTLP